MYILKKDNIVNIDIFIDKDKLNNIIELMREKKKSSIENDIIYTRFISLIEEIRDYGFIHDGNNLLEYLYNYKLFEKYNFEAQNYFQKKLKESQNISGEPSSETIKKIILNLSNTHFAGLYGNKIQNDLNNIIDCFSIEENNISSSISQIDIHNKIVDASESSNKEMLINWKNIYFSAVRNNNIICLLNIKYSTNKRLIKE